MSALPDPLSSRAVLIGASQYETLEHLPAVRGNLEALSDLFETFVWGLPAAHCVQILDPNKVVTVSRAVRAAADEATDALLVYYAGHGLIGPEGRLHLAVPDSEQHSVHDTAVPFEWIRMAVQRSRANRKIVILDCCYSARAFGLQSANTAALAEIDGTYVLAAAAETAAALAIPGEPYTAFTSALKTVLQVGVFGAPELLDLETVFTSLRSGLKDLGLPDPQCLDRNHLGRSAFAPNAAFSPTTGAPLSTLLTAPRAADPVAFARVISVLLSSQHPTLQHLESPTSNRDAELVDDDGLHAFEAKSFAGPMTSSRKRQVEHSLASVARAEPILASWTLITPLDPTPSELAWFENLGGQYPFRLEWLGASWIEAQLRRHPEVRPYYDSATGK